MVSVVQREGGLLSKTAFFQSNKVFANGRLQRWPGVSRRHPATRQGRGLYDTFGLPRRAEAPSIALIPIP
jgi:hypothetical protein